MFSQCQLPLSQSLVRAARFRVLAQIAAGHTSRAAIAAKLGQTISQVSTAVEWLDREGYILTIWGQIDRLTPAGTKALAAHQQANPPKAPHRTPWRQLEEAVSPPLGGIKGGL